MLFSENQTQNPNKTQERYKDMAFTDEQKAAMNEYNQKFIAELNAEPIAQALNLTRAKGSGYICPICNNGAGADGTGADIKNNKIACYKNSCFKGRAKGGAEVNYQDVLGALRCINPNKSIADILKEHFGSRYNIADALKGTKPAAQTASQSEREPARHEGGQGSINIPPSTDRAQQASQSTTERTDLTESIHEYQKHLTDPEPTAYLQKRGISIETAQRYGLGYCPNWQSPTALKRGKNPPPSRRLIIPTTKYHYIARAVDERTEKKYQKMNEGSPALFNAPILQGGKEAVIFITEGAIDALSVIEAGGQAIGLNSTENYTILVNRLQEQIAKAGTAPQTVFIISLDNDEQGRKRADALAQELKRLAVSYIIKDISGDYKDPNDALTANREQFTRTITDTQRAAIRPDNLQTYIDTLLTRDIDQFKQAANRRTGFKMLDSKANGLHTGLYVIAAGTSIGKTTFALQIADQLAAAGESVLYFSLEQSRLELVTKSISRYTAIADINTAVTSLSIRKGYLPDNVLIAADRYQNDVQDRLSIIEANFDYNPAQIENYVKRFISLTGEKPVIFVDYLQILQPTNQNSDKRLAIDDATQALKRMSRDLNLTIFAISAINRKNYLLPMDMEAIKESGGIEYTADVIWGLQVAAISDTTIQEGERREKVREAKKAIPRDIELLCLKNRYGIASYNCNFSYNPVFDLFVEKDTDPDEPRPIRRI